LSYTLSILFTEGQTIQYFYLALTLCTIKNYMYRILSLFT